MSKGGGVYLKRLEMSTTKLDRDSWSTPQWLYNWLNWNYQFDIDLCASEKNKKHEFYFDKQMDSLKMNWSTLAKVGFLNPPYSNIKPWIEKAVQESQMGFTTILLIPTPNGESYYDAVFKHASEITFIQGRVAFIAPFDYTIKGKKGKPDRHIKTGDEVPGNTRGSCVVEFSPSFIKSGPTIHQVDRDETKFFFEKNLNKATA